MAKRKTYHKIWRVRIGSRDDLKPGMSYMDLPVRGSYLIESRFKNGVPTLHKKAFALAIEDGINNPIWLGDEWINGPYYRPADDQADPADYWKGAT